MIFSRRRLRVALADSLTRGYFLKPLRGCRDAGRADIHTAMNPPVPHAQDATSGKNRGGKGLSLTAGLHGG